MNPVMRLVQTLGVTSVPLGGFFVGGWSPATLLAVYWFENLFGTLLLAARIAVHWRLTRKRGHYERRGQIQSHRARRGAPSVFRSRGGGIAAIDRAARNASDGAARGGTGPTRARSHSAPRPDGRPVFLTDFTLVSLVFNLAHGFFLAFLLGVMLGIPPERSELEQGVIGVAALQVVAFAMDLRGLARWPFATLKAMVDQSLGRVVLVQLSLIGGMVLFAWWNEPRSFFGIFVVLKSLTDLGRILPQLPVTDTPPRWLVGTIGRFGGTGEFERYWRESHARDRRIAEEDEQIWDAAAARWVSAASE